MLRTTPYRRSGGRLRRQQVVVRAATAAVVAAGIVALTACGSSSSTSTTPAAVVAYQKSANTICANATKSATALTTRMTAAEKAKLLPTLADTKALIAAQDHLQTSLAAVPAPAEIKTTVATANAEFAQLVARSKVLLAQHGSQTIAYDAIDTKLNALAKSLDANFKTLGLTSCA
jgi:hypothetical protein